MKYKRFLAALTAVLLLFSITGCKKEPEVPYYPANPNEEFVLDIFASDELVGVMSDIVYRYSTYAPRASIRITYDEGAILAAKIEAGTPCDVYVSDEVSFMDWLDQECGEDKNPNRNDKIVSETRKDVAYGPGNEKYAEEELAEGEVYNTTFSAAVCRSTALPYEAEQFINFMLSEEVSDIYETYGFSRVEE
jgi:ABC-type molybdate transport system substrate-binding protein